MYDVLRLWTDGAYLCLPQIVKECNEGVRKMSRTEELINIEKTLDFKSKVKKSAFSAVMKAYSSVVMMAHCRFWGFVCAPTTFDVVPRFLGCLYPFHNMKWFYLALFGYVVCPLQPSVSHNLSQAMVI